WPGARTGGSNGNHRSALHLGGTTLPASGPAAETGHGRSGRAGSDAVHPLTTRRGIMSEHIAGKSIIVTGAASGFGRLVSEKLAAKGARLTCADINADGVEDVVAGIRALGGE